MSTYEKQEGSSDSTRFEEGEKRSRLNITAAILCVIAAVGIWLYVVGILQHIEAEPIKETAVETAAETTPAAPAESVPAGVGADPVLGSVRV